MDQRVKYKTWNHKNPRRKHREKPFDISLGNYFLSKPQKHRQQELKYMGLYKTKEPVHRKRGKKSMNWKGNLPKRFPTYKVGKVNR